MARDGNHSSSSSGSISLVKDSAIIGWNAHSCGIDIPPYPTHLVHINGIQIKIILRIKWNKIRRNDHYYSSIYYHI